MRLIDKQDDRDGGSLHLVDHGFQAILELAFNPRSGLQEPQIEGVDRHVAQRRGDIAFDHPQGEAFHHRRLAHPGLTGQDGVVLAAANQDVHHLADLKIASEDGIDLAFSGFLGKIDGELIQRLGARGSSRWSRRLTCSGSSGHILVFARAGDDVAEMLAQRFHRNLLEGLGACRQHPRHFVVAHEAENEVAGTDTGRLVID